MWKYSLIAFFCLTSALALATTPTSRSKFHHRRTIIDEDSCEDSDRDALLEYLRRISNWADDAITAVSPFSDDLVPEVNDANRHDFERIFRRSATRRHRLDVLLAYQIIRDETYRPLRDQAWFGAGFSRIILACEEFDGYGSECDDFGQRERGYATTSFQPPNHLLLCLHFFALDRHLPRAEGEHTHVTVLLQQMLEHFPDLLAPSLREFPAAVNSAQLTQFATAIALRRRGQPIVQDPDFQDEEDRMRLSDIEYTGPETASGSPAPGSDGSDEEFYDASNEITDI